ncbi:MAG: DUF4065 domain-containing protein [Chloroflexi bacterium]|nr:DUF4065 domain-containing protein [Chloroflexota bacterium]
MSYPAAAIANSFLDLARAHGKRLTPMQIQKLVYFAHGWHLAYEESPLSEEQAQAWRWGPVFPTLYHAVKLWGREPIERDVIAFRLIREDGHHRVEKSVPRVIDGVHTAFLETIWDAYGEMSGPALSSLSHDIDGPWYRVWHESGGAHGVIIPDELIQEYFGERLKAA